MSTGLFTWPHEQCHKVVTSVAYEYIFLFGMILPKFSVPETVSRYPLDGKKTVWKGRRVENFGPLPPLAVGPQRLQRPEE
jgi:hypothetical protein